MIYALREGKSHIPGEVFAGLETDTDRAVAIVGGAIVEQRLTEALKAFLVHDEKLLDTLLNPYGALGAFGVKVQIAYLTRAITKAGYDDLSNIVKIRNDFAHRFEINSFDQDSPKARCTNLRLVDEHILEMPPEEATAIKAGTYAPTSSGKMLWKYTGASKDLSVPRKRFTLAVSLLSLILANAVNNLKDPMRPPPWPVF
jgi:hypothetical protein